MKIVISPDSFKGSLTSSKICEILKEKIKIEYPAYRVVTLPLGDGGEGTVDAFLSADLNSEKFELYVKDLYLRKKKVYIAFLNDIAYIETAQCVGLEKKRLDVVEATSVGVGEMIKFALNKGAKKIILGLGGSGTSDCGIGMLYALGYKFYDDENKEIFPCGKNLIKIKKIDDTNADRRIYTTSFEGACDVRNPLFGENGCAYIFAPQKGATEDQVKMLDDGLRSFATISGIAPVPGTGAAGGLGAAIIHFFNGNLISGIEYMLNLLKFDEEVADADVVITGEGCVDSQTQCGKAVSGVLKHSAGKRVIILCGKICESMKNLNAEIVCINPTDEPLEISMKNAAKNLANTPLNI